MEQMRQFGGGPGSEMYGGGPGGQYPYNMGMMGMPPMGYGVSASHKFMRRTIADAFRDIKEAIIRMPNNKR